MTQLKVKEKGGDFITNDIIYKLEAIEKDVTELKDEIREIRKDIKLLCERYSRVETSVKFLKNGLNGVKHNLGELENKRVNDISEHKMFWKDLALDFIKMFAAAVLAIIGFKGNLF